MKSSSRSVYLDNSTTTRPSGTAISKMLTFYAERWGSLAQPHAMGQALFPAWEEAIRSIYHLVGATDQDAVVMTSSGAEAINHAILSTYQDVTLVEGKNHFITLTTEEAPAMMSLNRLASFGCATTFLKPNPSSRLTAELLKEAITPRTALVALSWANGLTGVIQPIREIAELCYLRGVRLLVDATHILGKLFYELNDLPIDFLAFNGEQLHAPKGTGGLYIRQGVRLSPFIVGGIEQAGLRAGTVNVPGVIALGVAAREALDARDYLCTEVARLKFYFEKEIQKRIPATQVLFKAEERLPHITAIAFPHVTQEALLYLLNSSGVYASMGGGSQQHIGYLLKACDMDPMLASSSLSFSLSRETTEEEIDQAIAVIESAYHKLCKTSGNLVT